MRAFYAEAAVPGADYYTRRDPERARRNAVHQLQQLGYQVTLTPAAATA